MHAMHSVSKLGTACGQPNSEQRPPAAARIADGSHHTRPAGRPRGLLSGPRLKKLTPVRATRRPGRLRAELASDSEGFWGCPTTRAARWVLTRSEIRMDAYDRGSRLDDHLLEPAPSLRGPIRTICSMQLRRKRFDRADEVRTVEKARI